MRFIKQLFTWWSGQTLGTRLFTAFRGKRVGEDDLGNVYYQNRDGTRRWVVYHDYSEASQVPADWHGWLHKTFDNRPGQDPLEHQPWELPHRENRTGTVHAYVPKGSQYNDGEAGAPAPYQAWKPE